MSKNIFETIVENQAQIKKQIEELKSIESKLAEEYKSAKEEVKLKIEMYRQELEKTYGIRGKKESIEKTKTLLTDTERLLESEEKKIVLETDVETFLSEIEKLTGIEYEVKLSRASTIPLDNPKGMHIVVPKENDYFTVTKCEIDTMITFIPKSKDLSEFRIHSVIPFTTVLGERAKQLSVFDKTADSVTVANFMHGHIEGGRDWVPEHMVYEGRIPSEYYGKLPLNFTPVDILSKKSYFMRTYYSEYGNSEPEYSAHGLYGREYYKEIYDEKSEHVFNQALINIANSQKTKVVNDEKGKKKE